MSESLKTDFLVVGGGIIGLSIARELGKKFAGSKIILIEKESEVALHASGRNSGVLHAGFYYTQDSLKAKFCVDGNKQLTEYCLNNGLPINCCGKVVVAKNENELEQLFELNRRGQANGVDITLIDEHQLKAVEPNAKTHKYALYSPTTSTVDPKQVCEHIKKNLDKNVEIRFDTSFLKKSANTIITNNGRLEYDYLINAAGSYADKIAHQYDVGLNYTMIPFKGLYMRYYDDNLLKMHVYPVPNLKNPFLGVHWTKTVDGHVKIGPTSIPAFWRENYSMKENFVFGELVEILFREAKQFMLNSTFRSLAFDEMKKYYRRYLCNQATKLVKSAEYKKYGEYIKPGIRAQLLDKNTLELVMDFKVEHKDSTTHVLNAVSPAFTCAFSFAKYIVEEITKRVR